jgi:Icc-related predicted phosphoesterase
MSGYETKNLPDGKIELWWEGENVKTLHGVYENEEELNEYRERLQKQDERDQFLSHTLKDGKRRKVVVRDPDPEDTERSGIKAIIISDDITQVGNLDSQQIDVLISLGDLMDYNLIRASEVYQPAWILAVRGNHDDPRPFQDPIQDLHMQVTEIKGVLFGGFSGSWKYKDQGAYLFNQEEVNRMLANFPTVDVFIAHNSPWGVHERDKDVHQGFEAFREYIDRVQPRYFFHGHQHVNQVTMIGNTEVVGVYGEIGLDLKQDNPE